MDPETVASLFVSIAIAITVILIIGYYVYLSRLPSAECSKFDSLYSSNNKHINPINENDDNTQYTLKDYYIMTAYNSCSGGSYKNDYVELCALKSIIKQGVRCLDFEIYSVGNEPVVATSTIKNNYVKETYNSIPFNEVMDLISNYAFSTVGLCPNGTDPLLIHLRLKSTNQKMFTNLAGIFKKYDYLFLGPEHSYENQGKNIGDMKLLDLKGKIVLIVDKLTDSSFMENKEFYEYVNMTSNSIFMRAIKYFDIKNTPDLNELQTFNKTNMSIVLPDASISNPENSNAMVSRETGCQLVAMRFQLFDEYLKENLQFFEERGSAFVLKPEKLRYIPIEIPEPDPQDPALSYEERKVTSDYYNFSM
jgi:hypothetical protein